MKNNDKPLNTNKNLNKRIRKNKLFLGLVHSALVFLILIFTLLIVSLILYILIKNGIMPEFKTSEGDFKKIISLIALISLVTGTAISFGSNYYAITPLGKLTGEMNRLASGNFKTRLKFPKPIRYLSAYKTLEESFNTMAEELQNTEMLRSDFINNFSHEFKTPIVSIAGFAKMLQRDNLSDEEKKEYARIIEKESMRLSFLATNILNLTKLENQNILTNSQSYNVSEQIRECILMFEQKWREKNIEIELNFDEYYIVANQELMVHVFINLIDNAIKFTPEYGKIAISIREINDEIIITLTNTGSEIAKENLKRIFNKFYQADESHSGEGGGVGLAIVKKIIDLHNANVYVESENMVTSFIITLQK